MQQLDVQLLRHEDIVFVTRYHSFVYNIGIHAFQFRLPCMHTKALLRIQYIISIYNFRKAWSIIIIQKVFCPYFILFWNPIGIELIWLIQHDSHAHLWNYNNINLRGIMALYAVKGLKMVCVNFHALALCLHIYS